jgi:hypothetical protein
MKPKSASEIAQQSTLQIAPLDTGIVELCILGSTPLIQNRMAEKAKQELLFPRGRRLTSAEKQTNLKHDPIKEFRGAAYAPPDKEYATRLIIPARAFSDALADAALDAPGATKAQIKRLTTILALDGVNVPVYGIPQVYAAVVRVPDRNRTPDVRIRAILAKWAVPLQIRYIKPMLNANIVATLLAWAGVVVGLGDNRQQKGGSHGAFELVSPDDERFRYLIENCALPDQS